MLLLAALNFGFVKLDDVKEVGTYLTGIFPLPVSYTHLWQSLRHSLTKSNLLGGICHAGA